MRYLSVIRAVENQGPIPQALMDAMDEYVPRALNQGVVVSTGGLAPGAQGTRVRIRKGKIEVIDGPFTEAKEIIGGYAVLAADSREDAIRATREFMQLHVDHWPEWEGECGLGNIEIRTQRDWIAVTGVRRVA